MTHIHDSCPFKHNVYIKPLDLTVNEYVTNSTRGKFSTWYSLQIKNQLDVGKQLHDIDVPLGLSLLKPLHSNYI